MAKKEVSASSLELSGKISINNTLAANGVVKIDSAISIDENRAMRIRLIEYYFGFFDSVPADGSLLTSLAAASDDLKFGLSFLAAQPSGGFLETSPGVIDFNRVRRVDIGTAAEGDRIIDPVISKKMTERFPDGILIHPASLYTWFYTQNALGAACYIPYKIYYTMEDITDQMRESFWKQIFVTQAG